MAVAMVFPEYWRHKVYMQFSSILLCKTVRAILHLNSVFIVLYVKLKKNVIKRITHLFSIILTGHYIYKNNNNNNNSNKIHVVQKQQ